MPTVNDGYVRGVNEELKRIQYELPEIVRGNNPHSPRGLRELIVLAGGGSGWHLSGRIRQQGEGLSQACDTEMTKIDEFRRSVDDFLVETDETELTNISAQDFQSYLPGDGPSPSTTTTTG